MALAVRSVPISARSTLTWTASSTRDPRIVPSARRIPSIDYESILEMASCGSKVLALRCVEYAQRFNMPLHVRSSFSRRPGTLVVPDGIDPRTLPNLD